MTPDETEGIYGRITPRRLLRFPAFAPFLAGFEPYSALLKSLRSVTYPAAVKEFPYDWRLPVAYTGGLLADFAIRHLVEWRNSEQEVAARRQDPEGDRPARLVIVAHSMGGLLVRQACRSAGFAEEVRATVTLGTPFFGAPKAVQMLAAPGRTLLPRERLQELARGLPGVYDLLPTYRCVADGAQARRLTASDVDGVGGDGTLAETSFSWQESVSAVQLPHHEQVVGVNQPTTQSLTIEAGAVTGHEYTYERTTTGVQKVALGGDGTVPMIAARIPDGADIPLAQSHGALASHSDSQIVVEHVLAKRRRGPWLGGGGLGLSVPDVVVAGSSWEASVNGTERAGQPVCSVVDVATGLVVDIPEIRPGAADGVSVALVSPLPVGLFRVSADGGGTAPVQQMVMVTPDTGRPAR